MSEAPRWQEIKKNVKLLVVVVSTLLGLLFLFLTVLGIAFWIFTGDIIFLGASLIFFSLFIPPGYIVKKFEKEWVEFERKRGYTPPTRADILKGILRPLAALIGFSLLFIILDQFIGLFPKTIETHLAIEIVRIIIQLNGILIGFSGIVFAQLFWAVHSQQNVLHQELLKVKVSRPRESQISEILIRLKELEAVRRSLIVNLLSSVVPFVISILLGLSKIAWSQFYLEGYPSRLALWDSLLWMWIGIGFLTFFTIRTKLVK